MRKLALLLLTIVACGEHEPEVRLLSGLHDKPVLPCEPRETRLTGFSVKELSNDADGALHVLLDDERSFHRLDGSLQPTWTLQFDEHGPRGARAPTSAVIMDSVVYLVDRPLPRLKRFALDGRPLTGVELPFIPLELVRHNDDLLVLPAVMGDHPENLVYRLSGERLAPEPLKPYEARHATIKAVANMLAPAVLHDRVLLVHEFVTPTAYLWRGSNAPVRIPAPVAREFASSVGYEPPMPPAAGTMERMLAVALAVTARPAAGEFLVLARSGFNGPGHQEKILLRMDSAFQYLDAYRVDMNAGFLAMMPDSQGIVLVDEEYNWHTCRLP